MLEATAGGLSRSAGASPSQSPSRGTRLQQKARALAADLDSKLSFALKARQALPSSTWRPEEVALPARKSLPSAPVVNQAVPLKAVLQSPKTTLPAEAFQERRAETGPVPRTEATEKKLEELVQRLQVEQKARQVFEEEMQKKLQVSMDAALQKLFQAMETHGGSAQRSGAKDQLQEEMALLSRTLEEKLAVSQSEVAAARDGLVDLQQRVSNCEAAHKSLEQKRQRKEMEGPALVQMVTSSEEQMQQLRQDVASLDRRLSQAVNDHCESWQLQMASVKKEVESLVNAQSGIESALQEKFLTLSGSYAEVRKDMATLEETWLSRLQDAKSSRDALKSNIIQHLEEARPWKSDLTQLQEAAQEIKGKPWQRDLAQLQQSLAQQIQEAASENSKSIVACQGRLSSARLDTHEKMQGLEERLSHAEKRSSEAREAWLNGEPALRQVQAALKEVAELRDFTMDQSSKLQNNVQSELSNLESKVLRECDTTRQFCNEQQQQVEEIHNQLRLELKEAVSNARGVAEELAKELLRLKNSEEPSNGIAKQMEELKEKMVADLMALEARLHAEEASTRQFTSDQAAQLRVAMDDLQVAVQKLQNGTIVSEADRPDVPKAEAELSLEEVKRFETVRMTKLNEAKAESGSQDTERPRDVQRSQGRQQRQELLQRLSDAESRLQQQHGLVQRQKEDLEQLRKKP